MLFEWRLASMSLRQTYMLHVNVTRMFGPNGTEAAKFLLAKFSADHVLNQWWTSTVEACLLPIQFETSPFFPSLLLPVHHYFLLLSCFSITLPPSFLASFLSFLPPSSFSLPPSYFLAPHFWLQLGTVKTLMQSKGGYSNGSDVPESVTPKGTFVVRARK